MKQTILVTGSSSGFGRLTVETLARRGHTVFATMREAEGRNAPIATQLNQFAETVPGTVIVLEMDVTIDESVTAAVHRVSDTTDHLDAVVNNAGVFTGGLLEAYTLEQIHQIFDTNVY